MSSGASQCCTDEINESPILQWVTFSLMIILAALVSVKVAIPLFSCSSILNTEELETIRFSK